MTQGVHATRERERLRNLIARCSVQAPREGQDRVGAGLGMERLLELSRNMNRIQQRDALLLYIRDRLQELFEAENSEVLLVGRDGALSSLVAAQQPHAEGPEISETLIRRVIAAREPVLVTDASEDPDLQNQQSVLRLGLVSILCAPLIVDEDVIGIVHFDHRHRMNPFTEEDLALLRLFCNQAATALHNALLAEERQEALDQVRETQAELVATECLRALGQMAAGVAHDFNNMLTTVVGLSDLVRSHPRLPEELQTDLERLHTCALDGAASVKRLQTFAGRGNHEASELAPVDLGAVAEEVAAMSAHRCVPRGDGARHRVVTVLGPARPALADASELREVAINLVNNALDAMVEGGTVTLRTLERGGQVVLEVEDEGPGIAPEHRQRIFEPFFTTKETGHGLGLSMCWGIIKGFGGSIDVRPASRRGTIFAISLPVASSASTHHTTSNRSAHAAPRAVAARPRVLVVDDDAMVRDVMSRMIARAEVDVLAAEGGQRALEICEQESIDVIVTDLAMRRMDGLALARTVAERWPGLPVILATGWNHGTGPQTDDAPGVTLSLSKPVSAEAIQAAVRRVLASPGRARSGAPS